MKGDVAASQGEFPEWTHNRDDAAEESVSEVAGACQVKPSHVA